MKVLLLGATFTTGNMGVGALTAGAIKSILYEYPEAEIKLLEYGRESITYPYLLNKRNVAVQLLNLRFSKKLYLENNVARLLGTSLLLRFLPLRRAREHLIARNPYLRQISEADIVASIAGGDSFSDIYGLGRFMYVALPQLLTLCLGKKLIHLPQTLGPFKKRITRTIGRYILGRASLIYSRDREGLEEIRKVLPAGYRPENVRFCYDLGFVVDPVAPQTPEMIDLFRRKMDPATLVGLNISGLLYMGGYTQNNMFGLKLDYREFVLRLINFLVETKGAQVVLIPHVFGTAEERESDAAVCQKVYEEVRERYPEKVFTLREQYDQGRIKYIIGLCDFFIGSRMHACIAALSQNIPAVAIAYSKKFKGVLKTIGAESLVADPRLMTEEEIFQIVDLAYDERDLIRNRLQERIPEVKEKVLRLFGEIRGFSPKI